MLTDEQYTMFLQELQIALMLMAEFSGMYFTRKLYQLCHLNKKFCY
jgi:hypothetical protein